MTLPTWVLQRDSFSHILFEQMAAHLARTDRLPVEIRMVPFTDQVLGLSDPPPRQWPVVCYGRSPQLGAVAKRMAWHPGVFAGKFSMERAVAALGDDMLNAGGMAVDIEDAGVAADGRGWDRFFVRPDDDEKVYPGEVMTLGTFLDWVARLKGAGLLGAHRAFIAPVREIWEEARFVMVGGRAVAGCTYRSEGSAIQARARSAATEFAERIASRWQPLDIYVMDVAQTEDGLKVIEHNVFNHTGLYDCDVAAVIDAIDQHVGSAP